MQIAGERVQREAVKINVRPEDVWKQLRQSVLSANGMSNVEYLRHDGQGRPQFKADEEHRHGSISEYIVINEPTEQQLKVWEALVTIDNEVKRVQAHESR